MEAGRARVVLAVVLLAVFLVFAIPLSLSQRRAKKGFEIFREQHQLHRLLVKRCNEGLGLPQSVAWTPSMVPVGEPIVDAEWDGVWKEIGYKPSAPLHNQLRLTRRSPTELWVEARGRPNENGHAHVQWFVVQANEDLTRCGPEKPALMSSDHDAWDPHQ